MNYNDVQNDIGLVINGTFIVSMVFFSLFGILYIVQIVFYIILAIKVNKLKDIYQNSQLMSILFIVSIFIPIVGLISSVYVLSNSIKIINRLQAVNVNDLDNSSDPSKPILPTNPPSPYPF
ncbi:hypothetical protein IKS57_04735 [bacterium]|nr:hypothetical protein [bacterium]